MKREKTTNLIFWMMWLILFTQAWILFALAWIVHALRLGLIK